MRKTDIYGYYAFGFNYALIKNKGLLGYKKDTAIQVLGYFFHDLTRLELQVTQLIAKNLQEIFESLKDSEEEKVNADVAAKIAVEVARLDSALDAELKLKAAYVLTKKKYPLDTLLSTPEELLGTGIYGRLSDTGKRDFQLACTQIALSQPTAASFHLMRMLEEQVKALYFSFKKTNRLKTPMWGPMTKELRDKRAPKPSEKLLNHLDGMRIHFRNPTQHPEMFYSIDEAQDLLNQTVSAVNMIYAELS